MAVNPEFQKMVNEKNTLMVRIMLKDSLVVDPTFVEFDQLLSAAEAGLPELYDVHDGEVLNCNPQSWTKDYMDEQMVQIIDNFSHERLKLLRDICKHLFSDRAEKIESERIADAHCAAPIGKKQAGIGLAAGGIAFTAVGIAISKPIIIAAGVAAVIVGGILIATDK